MEILKIILFLSFIICFAITAFLEPSKPKIDRRFKTGYKDNARPKQKSEQEENIQTICLFAGIASFIAWYFI